MMEVVTSKVYTVEVRVCSETGAVMCGIGWGYMGWVWSEKLIFYKICFIKYIYIRYLDVLLDSPSDLLEKCRC